MELIFRMAGRPTPLRLPSQGTLSVGRSSTTDCQVEGLRVSAVHVQITEGPNPMTITVIDVSQNGTGLVAHSATPVTATLLHRASAIVEVGTGILLPMEHPVSIVQKTVDDVLWLEIQGQPEHGHRDLPQPAPLPLQAPQPTPATWPSKWATLHQSVKNLWVREDIRNPMDLAGSYTSEKDFTEELEKAGVPKTDCPLAITFWKSAPRDMRQMSGVKVCRGTT